MQFKHYTKEFKKRITNSIMHGNFSNRTIPSDLMLVSSTSNKHQEKIKISLLVSREDGMIFDAKFNCYGAPYLIGMCEILMENLIRKTYAQIQHISAEYIEKLIKDKSDQPLPSITFSAINSLLELIDDIADQCKDLPVQDTYLQTPIEHSLEKNCIDDFFTRPTNEQLSILNTVIDEHIKPYVELDQGNVAITTIEKTRITIKYEGSCTSCIASTGSTLSAIQSILQTRVHPTLSVHVDPKSLSHL